MTTTYYDRVEATARDILSDIENRHCHCHNNPDTCGFHLITDSDPYVAAYSAWIMGRKIVDAQEVDDQDVKPGYQRDAYDDHCDAEEWALAHIAEAERTST